MRLLVEFSHPAQVHKFKHALAQLRKMGVEILILSRDKDVMLVLLDQYELPHLCISRARSGLLGNVWELLVREWKTLFIAMKFRPNLMLSAHSVAITHAGWIMGIPRLVHEDTEFGHLQQKLYIPFATRVLTSTAYYLDWGEKQLRIPSLEPLAYLHPKYFSEDPARLKRYGLSANSRYVVLRLISWQAMHDRGLHGITQSQMDTVVETLLSLGYEKVVLSTEGEFGQMDWPEIVRPDPEDLHHLLAFAELCFSESITVAGEAAVLGTPTLLVNPLRAGHTLELERYNLVERCDDLDNALSRAVEISADHDSKARALASRSRLLEEKSDMTEAFVEIISQELGLQGQECNGYGK